MAKVGCDVICKSHSARSDRDPYRICPTKLSKQELENLYFALLENNLELKKTINGQQDRIKILSTKVQRITSTHNVLRSEGKKDCCFAMKAIVNQQKELITDLKRSNERMAERIRKLNMRLCSAKQFCKSATPRCLRCSTSTSPYLIKNSSPSLKQHSQSTLKLAISCQNLSRDTMITKCVQTDSPDITKDKDDEKPCEDNKCRSLLDELRQKIVNLDEELSRTQESCSSLQREVVRARSQRVAAEHELAQRDNKNMLLVTNLRAAEGLITELKTQLSIEKRKVAELETRLKAATISYKVTKSIEDTLTSIQESNKNTTTDVTSTCTCSPHHNGGMNVQQSGVGGLLSPKLDHGCDDTKLSKSTDDSGYVDINKSPTFLDDQSLNKIIEDLSKRIVVLQARVDYLTISSPEADPVTIAETSTITEDHITTLNEIKSTPNPKPNKQTPSKIPIKTSKDTLDNSREEVLKNDMKNTSKDLSEPIPISESTPTTGWKNGVAKINLVNKMVKEKDSKNTEDNETTNKAKNENRKDTSTGVEKTYNVYEKDDNVEKDKNNFEIDKCVSEKDKDDTKKDKDETKEDNNVVKNDRMNEDKTLIEMDSRSKPTGKRYTRVKTLEIHKSVEKKAQGARCKTLARAKTEFQDTSSCEEGTYTVDYDKSTRPDSPDNTDYEISSMTDVSEEEREPKSPSKNRLSPGERKYTSTLTESCTSPTTNYSLSEGEIPAVTIVRRRSNEDKPNQGKVIAPKIDETLQAITDEMARCKRLLFSSRSHDTSTTALI